MDIALSGLRTLLLGALGGLTAFALAGWMGLSGPSPSTAHRPRPPALMQPVVQQAGLVATVEIGTAAARRFIAEAAEASLYDAHAAHLMQGRSADAAVQDLAATLLRDHDAAWPALRVLAHHRGVALPGTPTVPQRQALALLNDVAEHTRAHLFVRHVGIESALLEIARFEAALDALDVRDAPLRVFIDQTLLALRERAALSQRLLPQVAKRQPMA